MTSIRPAPGALLLCLAIATPAASLALSDAPRSIGGIAPGMEPGAVRTRREGAGMTLIPGSGPRMGSSADRRDETGALVGSAFSFGDPAKMEIIHVDVGAGEAQTDRILRVSAIIGADRLDEAARDRVMAAFGTPACGAKRFRYDADRQPVATGRCGHVLLDPLAPMAGKTASYAGSGNAPRHAAILGATQGETSQLILSIQDNLLAGRIRLSGPEDGADPEPAAGPAEHATAASDPARSAEPAVAAREDIPEAERIAASPPCATDPAWADRGVEILGAAPGMSVREPRDRLLAQGCEVTPWSRFRPTHDIDEMGAKFYTLNLPRADDGRDTVRGDGYKHLSLRKLEDDNHGQVVTLHAVADGKVYRVQYVRNFAEGGPYPEFAAVMGKVSERMNGIEPLPHKEDLHSPGMKFWFLDQDGKPLAERPEDTLWWQRYSDASEFWDQVRGSSGDLAGRDFIMFRAKLGTLRREDSDLVETIVPDSLSLRLIVSKLEQAYREPLGRTELETRAIDF